MLTIKRTKIMSFIDFLHAIFTKRILNKINHIVPFWPKAQLGFHRANLFHLFIKGRLQHRHRKIKINKNIITKHYVSVHDDNQVLAIAMYIFIFGNNSIFAWTIMYRKYFFFLLSVCQRWSTLSYASFTLSCDIPEKYWFSTQTSKNGHIFCVRAAQKFH